MSFDNMKELIKQNREIMKIADYDEESDQNKGLPQPPLAKESISDTIITLSDNFDYIIKNNDFLELMNTRTSKRKYKEDSLTLEELAFLLWSTQGVKSVIGKARKATMRTVPSAGARHPFETYLFVNSVKGLQPGLYHYLALEHKLEYLGDIENQVEKVTEAYCGQTFFATAAVSFVWTVVPYRSEWRYTVNAQKYALVDVGHVCQNLYLACEAIGCGACAIGAYDQKLADGLLGLDSSPTDAFDNEFVIYAASVGRAEE